MINFERIQHAAEQLFRQFGVRSVSMSDIATNLGVSKKTLYLHISNKNDLVRKIMEAHIQKQVDFCKAVKEKAQDAIDEMLLLGQFIQEQLKGLNPTLLFDLQKYHHEVWQLLDNFHNQDVRQMMEENLQRGISEGVYRKELQVEIISTIYVKIINIMTQEFPTAQIEGGFAASQHEFMNYHLHGILSPEGHKQLSKYLNQTTNQ